MSSPEQQPKHHNNNSYSHQTLQGMNFITSHYSNKALAQYTERKTYVSLANIDETLQSGVFGEAYLVHYVTNGQPSYSIESMMGIDLQEQEPVYVLRGHLRRGMEQLVDFLPQDIQISKSEDGFPSRVTLVTPQAADDSPLHFRLRFGQSYSQCAPAVHINLSHVPQEHKYPVGKGFSYEAMDVDVAIHTLGLILSGLGTALHKQTHEQRGSVFTLNMLGNAAKKLLAQKSAPKVSAKTQPKELVPIAPLAEHANFPTFADFGGLDEEIKTLNHTMQDFLSPKELLAQYGIQPAHGILLQGEGGVGKTQLIRALAREYRCALKEISATDIISSSVGQSAHNLKQHYQTAKESGITTILFIDEFDGLFSKNAGGNHGAAQLLISEFKTILTNPQDYPNVLTVCAANSLDNFDPALLRAGRFDTVIKIPTPREEARTAIFRTLIGKSGGLFDTLTLNNITGNHIDYDQLAKETDEFTGADITAVVTGVLKQQMRAEVATGTPPPPITHTQLVAAIRNYRRQRLAE
ncbi:MAG TPA: ATP-binding protein [Candidatus Saccharibacteria bacterium]|nr:ATP-binding protein [Candidatus Saccharibacteria bacterium]